MRIKKQTKQIELNDSDDNDHHTLSSTIETTITSSFSSSNIDKPDDLLGLNSNAKFMQAIFSPSSDSSSFITSMHNTKPRSNYYQQSKLDNNTRQFLTPLNKSTINSNKLNFDKIKDDSIIDLSLLDDENIESSNIKEYQENYLYFLRKKYGLLIPTAAIDLNPDNKTTLSTPRPVMKDSTILVDQFKSPMPTPRTHIPVPFSPPIPDPNIKSVHYNPDNTLVLKDSMKVFTSSKQQQQMKQPHLFSSFTDSFKDIPLTLEELEHIEKTILTEECGERENYTEKYLTAFVQNSPVFTEDAEVSPTENNEIGNIKDDSRFSNVSKNEIPTQSKNNQLICNDMNIQTESQVMTNVCLQTNFISLHNTATETPDFDISCDRCLLNKSNDMNDSPTMTDTSVQVDQLYTYSSPQPSIKIQTDSCKVGDANIQTFTLQLTTSTTQTTRYILDQKSTQTAKHENQYTTLRNQNLSTLKQINELLTHLRKKRTKLISILQQPTNTTTRLKSFNFSSFFKEMNDPILLTISNLDFTASLIETKIDIYRWLQTSEFQDDFILNELIEKLKERIL